jgi:hypothetical protein
MRLRLRVSPILPLVLLIVDVLQTIVDYKVREHVHNTYWRAGIKVVLIGVAFTIAAGWVAPGLTALLKRLRKETATAAGEIGLWGFYAIAYGGIFYVYLVLERFGPSALLPASLK